MNPWLKIGKRSEMKIEAPERVAEFAGFVEEKSFTIAANGKAFRVLIDKLYSNVHQAIVRELMTNAWDAHVMMANPKPFEVHVPTAFEPYFSIRDFGCAMTHDQVMNVYSTIFESTKDARDDQVGAWGLGSKTPFAYTDTFSVQVWLDGHHRVYNVFIDASGVPKIALALDEDNDGAATGVEISFPVASKDSGLFKAALETVSIGFEPKPKFSTALQLVELEHRRQGNGWFTYANPSGGAAWLKKPVARVGCVLYPIKLDVVCEFIESNNLQIEFVQLLNSVHGFCNSPMILDFPIGGVEITANREDLYYSSRTVKTIIDRFETIIKEMKDEFLANIKKGKTLYEINMQVLEVCDMFSDVAAGVSDYLCEFARQQTFKGRHLLKKVRFDHKAVTTEIGKDDKGFAIFQRDPTRYQTIEYVHYQGSKFVRKPGLQFYCADVISWDPQPTDFYVELPPAKGIRVPYAARRIRHDRSEASTTSRHDLVWIRTPSLSDPHFVKMMIGFGRPLYKLVNDLVKPPGILSSHYQAALRKFDTRRNVWEKFIDFDIDNDAGYYVMLTNGLPDHLRGVHLGNLLTFLEHKHPNKNFENIVGIPRSRKGVLNKSDQWVDLVPELQEAYRQALDVKQAAIVFSIKGINIDKNQEGGLEKLKYGFSTHRLGKFSSQSPFTQAIKAYDRLGEIEATVKEFNEAWNHRFILGHDERSELDKEYDTLAKSDPQLIAEITDIKSAISKVSKSYPLLSKVYNPSNADLRAMDKYIVAIDLLDNLKKTEDTILLDNPENAGHIADSIETPIGVSE